MVLVALLQSDYCSQGYLNKADIQSDNRKTTLHSENVSCQSLLQWNEINNMDRNHPITTHRCDILTPRRKLVLSVFLGQNREEKVFGHLLDRKLAFLDSKNIDLRQEISIFPKGFYSIILENN